MNSDWAIAGFGSAFVAVGAVLFVSLLRVRRELRQTGAVQLLGDLVRLMVGLLRDDTMPWHVRARIGGAILYNAQPINLIPDFIPVVGFADNLAVTYWALRSTVRAAGPEALRRNWPGSEEGLALVLRLAGVVVQEPGDRIESRLPVLARQAVARASELRHHIGASGSAAVAEEDHELE